MAFIPAFYCSKHPSMHLENLWTMKLSLFIWSMLSTCAAFKVPLWRVIRGAACLHLDRLIINLYLFIFSPLKPQQLQVILKNCSSLWGAGLLYSVKKNCRSGTPVNSSEKIFWLERKKGVFPQDPLKKSCVYSELVGFVPVVKLLEGFDVGGERRSFLSFCLNSFSLRAEASLHVCSWNHQLCWASSQFSGIVLRIQIKKWIQLISIHSWGPMWISRACKCIKKWFKETSCS